MYLGRSQPERHEKLGCELVADEMEVRPKFQRLWLNRQTTDGNSKYGGCRISSWSIEPARSLTGQKNKEAKGLDTAQAQNTGIWLKNFNHAFIPYNARSDVDRQERKKQAVVCCGQCAPLDGMKIPAARRVIGCDGRTCQFCDPTYSQQALCRT